MQEDNVFILGEKTNNGNQDEDNQSNGNNCVGHKQAMKVGGQGHYDNDNCDCPPTISTDMYVDGFIIIAVAMIIGIVGKRILVTKQLNNE